MEIKYNLTGTERKALVKTVSNISEKSLNILEHRRLLIKLATTVQLRVTEHLKFQTTPTMIRLSIYLKSCMSADMKPRMMKMLIFQTQIKILQVKQ